MIKRKGSDNVKGKGRGQHIGIGKSVIYGCLTSISVTIIFLCIGAYLEGAEIISGNIIDSIVFGIQFLSTAFGCTVALRKTESNLLLSSIITALGYFIFMSIISLLLFDGGYSSVFRGLLALALGEAAALWVVWTRKKRCGSRRRKAFSR